MKLVTIYQTLEDRGNYNELKKNGPCFCSEKDKNGELKKGVREPWLGPGYYFWDSLIDDAKWWGETTYWKEGKGYVIYQTSYDQHSDLLYDLHGDIKKVKEFKDAALFLKNLTKKNKITIPFIINFLRKNTEFPYKAIRVMPTSIVKNPYNKIIFPSGKYFFKGAEKVQICFFDKTLLTQPFEFIEKQASPTSYNSTI